MYDTRQLATAIGVPEDVLEGWRSVGVGPVPMKLLGRWIYTEHDIGRWQRRVERLSRRASAGDGARAVALDHDR